MVSLIPSSYSPPFASRLKLLRERERNWKYLDWKQRHTLSLPPTGSVYEFVGGLYGNGTEDNTRATASISFIELPCLDAFILGRPKDELKAWTHSMEDVNNIDFTMDPSQDLLVLVALAPREYVVLYCRRLLLSIAGRPTFTNYIFGPSKQTSHIEGLRYMFCPAGQNPRRDCCPQNLSRLCAYRCLVI